MMTIAGHSYFTDFQKAALLAKLNANTNLVVHDLISQEVFVFAGYLSNSDKDKACELLTGGQCFELHSKQADELELIVTPRVGTISPWSSKAMDIFNNAGLHVPRFERVAHIILIGEQLPKTLPQEAEHLLHDCMTQSVLYQWSQTKRLFVDTDPSPLHLIDVMGGGREALVAANDAYGFALSDEDMDYLLRNYNILARNPTDTELMMFAQANSEHCRHKIFNSEWVIDGQKKDKSLFKMIKNTHEQSPDGVLSAYKDNAAVIEGFAGRRLYPIKDDMGNHEYHFVDQSIDILMKVETHNHPTAIAPFAGAATGAGGEIRDEGATGRGGKPKAGLTGFSVSHLHLPQLPELWEQDSKSYGKPSRIASALEIMTTAPLGSAAFNNEFGRPNLTGYFRSFQLACQDGVQRGYHKPIMIAGGYGDIARPMVKKGQIKQGDLLIVLGGPAMQIGLGGGAASSVDGGKLSEQLDFASVQRDNAEMERRCQEVIDRCWGLDDNNPIVSIHDVGAGGLSNAMPELVDDSGLGATLELRAIPSLEAGMSPMALWSNEAQERYVLAIAPFNKERFDEICVRERCPYAILGEATDVRQLKVTDELLGDTPVDMPMQVLLGGMPVMKKNVRRRSLTSSPLSLGAVDIGAAILSVLRHPSVASKSFLISIGDRSVTGLVTQDQYVGAYQVPVADCAVTATDFFANTGCAMAMGERSPVALIDSKAAARLAVAESITNIAGTCIDAISDITLSANWMAACGEDSEDVALYEAVEAVGEELCPVLGVAIPVGKDSLSMRVGWGDDHGQKSVVSPVSLVISAFAPVQDITKTVTPNLKNTDAFLYRLDLSGGQYRLGGSILAQTLNQLGDDCPDLDHPKRLIDFFNFIQAANKQGLICAYHDISDGGMIAAVCEMQFTARVAIDLHLEHDDTIAELFAEELGAVVQVLPEYVADFTELADEFGLSDLVGQIGQTFQTTAGGNDEDILTITAPEFTGEFARSELQREWTKVSHAIASLRDNPDCADQEFALIDDIDHTGLIFTPNYDLNQAIEAPYIASQSTAPKVAILREQGVNGHVEMAAGFKLAGFDTVDVHMSDLLAGRISLGDFQGLVACGGFSYGDVLGAGTGWANSVLFSPKVRDEFIRFFHRDSTFALGVCNGCQMMAQLKELMVGAEHFPRFIANKSARFEARTVNVKVERTKSVLLKGMQDSILPIAVAHGEGFADLTEMAINELSHHGQIALRYVDSQGRPTEHYPLNPNGSAGGITGICSNDGRVTLMMPHPERTLRAVNHAYRPDEWTGDGAWLRLFRNARAFVR